MLAAGTNHVTHYVMFLVVGTNRCNMLVAEGSSCNILTHWLLGLVMWHIYIQHVGFVVVVVLSP